MANVIFLIALFMQIISKLLSTKWQMWVLKSLTNVWFIVSLEDLLNPIILMLLWSKICVLCHPLPKQNPCSFLMRLIHVNLLFENPFLTLHLWLQTLILYHLPPMSIVDSSMTIRIAQKHIEVKGSIIVTIAAVDDVEDNAHPLVEWSIMDNTNVLLLITLSGIFLHGHLMVNNHRLPHLVHTQLLFCSLVHHMLINKGQVFLVRGVPLNPITHQPLLLLSLITHQLIFKLLCTPFPWHHQMIIGIWILKHRILKPLHIWLLMEVLSTYFNYLSKNHVIMIGNAHTIPIQGYGSTSLSNPPLKLNNVLFAPNLVKNLISVRKLTIDNHVSIVFDPFGFFVKDFMTGTTILRCDSKEISVLLIPLHQHHLHLVSVPFHLIYGTLIWGILAGIF